MPAEHEAQQSCHGGTLLAGGAARLTVASGTRGMRIMTLMSVRKAVAGDPGKAVAGKFVTIVTNL